MGRPLPAGKGMAMRSLRPLRVRSLLIAISPPGLILEIDIGERLPIVVAHDKAGGLFLDGPRRREAACRHDGRTNMVRSVRCSQ
jgi:hypothetical protein